VAYQLLIFDFDGTLADSAPWMLSAIQRAADEFGFRKPTLADMRALRDRDSRAIMRALGIQIWRLPQIAAFIRDRAIAEAHPPLFPGVPDMLRDLAGAGRTLAIVSSNAEVVVRRSLGPELAGLFSAFACDASIFGKGAKFRRVMQETGVPRHLTMAIGDEGRDVEACRAARIDCGAVAWGYATPGLLASLQPERLFSTPADIAGLVRVSA
jgi:phosphoglycolate phosphatase